MLLDKSFYLTQSQAGTDLFNAAGKIPQRRIEESGLDILIRKCYEALDLITFLTTGEDETRAWTAKREMFIPQAARAIHTDFEKGFIRAEIVNWQDLIAAGGEAKAKEKGLDTLLAAAQKTPQIKYAIAGAGPEETRLKKFVENNNLE